MTNENRDNIKSDAEIFALLASFYNVNPEENFINAMKSLNDEAIEDNDVQNAIKQITSFDAENLLDAKRDWTKLFRGVSPDYGPKAPCEQLYCGRVDTDFLRDLGKLYADNGYSKFADLPDRPDYIGVELDFASFLSLLRLDAFEKGDTEKFNGLTQTFNDFVENRLAHWFPLFKQEADKYAATDFYQGALKLTALMLN